MRKIKLAYSPSKIKANTTTRNSRTTNWRKLNSLSVRPLEAQLSESWELICTEWGKEKRKKRKEKSLKTQERPLPLISLPNFCLQRCRKTYISQGKKRWWDREKKTWKRVQRQVETLRRQHLPACVNLVMSWFPVLPTETTPTTE